MMNKGLWIVALSVSTVIGVVVLMYFTYSNAEVRLRNRATAQQQVLEVTFDTTWKIIQQKAGVSDKYAKDFKTIYPDLMEGRYDHERGGALMSWITEHNPQFDISLYKDLMRSIEAERTKFANAQKVMIDIVREHDNIRTTVPGSLVVGGREPIVVRLVTSEKTQTAFATGREDNVDLFETGE